MGFNRGLKAFGTVYGYNVKKGICRKKIEVLTAAFKKTVFEPLLLRLSLHYRISGVSTIHHHIDTSTGYSYLSLYFV